MPEVRVSSNPSIASAVTSISDVADICGCSERQVVKPFSFEDCGEHNSGIMSNTKGTKKPIGLLCFKSNSLTRPIYTCLSRDMCFRFPEIAAPSLPPLLIRPFPRAAPTDHWRARAHLVGKMFFTGLAGPLASVRLAARGGPLKDSRHTATAVSLFRSIFYGVRISKKAVPQSQGCQKPRTG